MIIVLMKMLITTTISDCENNDYNYSYTSDYDNNIILQNRQHVEPSFFIIIILDIT